MFEAKFMIFRILPQNRCNIYTKNYWNRTTTVKIIIGWYIFGGHSVAMLFSLVFEP